MLLLQFMAYFVFLKRDILKCALTFEMLFPTYPLRSVSYLNMLRSVDPKCLPISFLHVIFGSILRQGPESPLPALFAQNKMHKKLLFYNMCALCLSGSRFDVLSL